MERRVEEKEKDRAPVKRRAGMKQSDAMVLGLVQSMRRLVAKLKVPVRHTEWSEYSKTHSYDRQAFDEKVQFVTRALETGRWNIAWDIGSNTGTFSQICAKYADKVIAVDGDHDAVEKLYLAERERGGTQILPLFMNLANISPSQGWGGKERTAFDQRNRPGFVICLALIHHMCLSANVPIPLFLDWLRSLEAKLVIEFVDRNDEMVQKLLANKKENYADYNRERFEQELRRRFRILASQDLKNGSRKIFFCEPITG
jgi:SAM-dependent methyltransferase